MPIRALHLAIVFAACLLAATAIAQTATSAPSTDSREFSEDARRAYAQSLKEARSLIAEKKTTEAIAILDRLTAERPREPQARFVKGVALADSGRVDEAIAVYLAVLGDYPELPEPQNNLAVLYARKGQYELAQDALQAAVRAAPDYAIAYENLGDVHARLAAVNYEKAVTHDARGKSAPIKLKAARELLTAPSAAAAPAAPTSTTAPSTPAPR